MEGNEDFRKNIIRYSTQIFATVVIVWILMGIFAYFQVNPGQFGDMFGAVNALFSGLAFAGIIITILLQSQELKETREELRGQKEALQLQSFESSFFNLMTRHSEVITALESQSNRDINQIVKGRDALTAITRRFVQFLGKNDIGGETLAVYEEFYRTEARFSLPYYFRSLEVLLSFLDQANAERRMQYAAIVRAQLSLDDVVILYLHGLSQFGKQSLKLMIERYALLEALPSNLNFQVPHPSKYDFRAFGGNTSWLLQQHTKK